MTTHPILDPHLRAFCLSFTAQIWIKLGIIISTNHLRNHLISSMLYLKDVLSHTYIYSQLSHGSVVIDQSASHHSVMPEIPLRSSENCITRSR